MELEGLEAVKHLRGHRSVRDGYLVNLLVHNIHVDPTIELTFEVSRDGEVRVVKLKLGDVREFDYCYDILSRPEALAEVKCLMTGDGEFYLSLDPWDEREEFISDKDNDYFRSKMVTLVETLKQTS